MADIDSTLLHKHFYYVNGELFRKTKNHGCKIGDKAGHLRWDGYNQVSFKNKSYLLHRLIFMMFHGYMPLKVDHIDGNTLNNCIENLRPVNQIQNQQNSKLRKSNTSGIKNVSFHKRTNKWRVQFNVNGVSKYIGSFDDLELAELVAIEARNKYHKEFARHK